MTNSVPVLGSLEPTAEALRLEAVSKSYHPAGGGHAIAALSDINLRVEKGSILGLVGASGSGKTTFLELAGERIAPTKGTISIGQKSPALVPQDIDLRTGRTVLENILIPLQTTTTPQWQATPKARSLLQRLGLEGLETRFPRELSAGERQKIAIARALISDPDFLLLDEPFAVLDRESAANVVAFLDAINQSNGTTIIVASRSPSTLKDLAHEIAVLDRGKIVEHGPAFELLTQPASAATRALVGAAFSASLPAFLEAKLTNDPLPGGQAIVRLIFTGNAATSPVITRLARDLGLDANILLGAAETIRGRLYGVLIVGVAAGEPYFSAALDHFEAAGLGTDIIGYLAPDAAP